MLSEKEKIELITQISLDLNETKDVDLLLERILTNVRKFFNADAGSIYLTNGQELRFSYTQNDTLQKRLEPGKKLIFNTFCVPIDNNSIAGFVANTLKTVNIPNVYALNHSLPFTFDPHFDQISNYHTESILAVPMTNQNGELLGVMQLLNARDEQSRMTGFSQIDESLIKYFATSAALALDRAQMTRNIILRMISMAELRDPRETCAHVNRVAAYAVEIYEAWAVRQGLRSDTIEHKKDLLRMAGMLHDVGKVAISDLILRKPARLTINEFEIMKSHTFLGARLFVTAHSDFDEVAQVVALNHHEKWDGSGYPGHMDPVTEKPLPGYANEYGQPRPKRGEEIQLFGRIVAVADVYDALCSRRSYKEPWDEDRILEEIDQASGKHFDPEITNAFFRSLEILKSIAQRYPDEI
jgi:HD-GYP domain-containing protein (c-di-GMP phosphodiesterase class II)